MIFLSKTLMDNIKLHAGCVNVLYNATQFHRFFCLPITEHRRLKSYFNRKHCLYFIDVDALKKKSFWETVSGNRFQVQYTTVIKGGMKMALYKHAIFRYATKVSTYCVCIYIYTHTYT